MSEDFEAFLRSRLDEDEQRAPDIHAKGCSAHQEHDWGYEFHPEWCDCGEPTRVLRDVEAKREILDEHRRVTERPLGGPECCRCVKLMSGWQEDWSAQQYPCRTLRFLASVHADHPGYQEAWQA